MIRTGRQYLDSIRDDREVYIDGQRGRDVTQNPMLRPLIDIRARIYDMQHEAATRDLLAYQEPGDREHGEWNAIGRHQMHQAAQQIILRLGAVFFKMMVCWPTRTWREAPSV